MENSVQKHNSSNCIIKISPTSSGCSKAHLSLLKILRIIQTIPPPPDFSREIPLAEMEEIQPPAAVDDERLIKSEVLQVQSLATKEEIEPFEIKTKFCDDKNQERNKRVNCKLGLLIEAARLILNEDQIKEENEEDEEEEMKEKKQRVVVGFDVNKAMRNGGQQLKAADLRRHDETEPATVVRSRRGRPQVLPEKYRDSVLDPFMRATTTRSRPEAVTRSKTIGRRKLLQPGS